MSNFWQSTKGYLAGAIALITCPCHLVITFPLLLTLTAGTALGSWLTGKFWLFFGISTVIFLAGLGLAVRWQYAGTTHGVKRHFGFVHHITGQHPTPATTLQAIIPKQPYGHELHLYRQDTDDSTAKST